MAREGLVDVAATYSVGHQEGVRIEHSSTWPLHARLTRALGRRTGASAAILTISKGEVVHETKPDGSPVTAADMASEVLTEGLRGIRGGG